MKVTLIARTQFFGDKTEEGARCRDDQLDGTDGEDLAEFAGRLCYDSFGRGRNSEEFAANIIEHGHVNVLYHPTFTFLIQGVSRNLTHELVRHHVGFSPSMRSTRYCDETDSDVVTHPDLRPLTDERHPYSVARELRAFDKAWRATYKAVVESMLAAGHDKKTAHGAAARYLPNGIETELVWTGNAQAFRSLIERRSIPGVVDAEFVQLAEEMRAILKVEMPRYFK